MPAYRFCRSDDIPLLCEAHEACVASHLAEVAPQTVDDFKHQVREIDLWASSCMVASAGGAPIGVLWAAKRESANLIVAVGVRPEHRRQGHGRHMLESLGKKLAILGPRRMLAEVPADWTDGQRLLEACGYRREREMVDYEVAAPAQAGIAIPDGIAQLLMPVTVDDLQAAGLFDTQADRCWERSPEALIKHRDRLRGIALGAGDRLGAWLLVDDRSDRETRDVMAVHAPGADSGQAAVLTGALLASFLAEAARPVRFRRVSADEVDAALLGQLGFTTGERTLRYEAEAGA